VIKHGESRGHQKQVSQDCVIFHVHAYIKGDARTYGQREENCVCCEMSRDNEDDSIEKYVNGVG